MFSDEQIRTLVDKRCHSWDQSQVIHPQLRSMPLSKLGSSYTASQPCVIWTAKGLPLRYAAVSTNNKGFHLLKNNQVFFFNRDDWMQRDSSRFYCLLKIEWHPTTTLITINHNQDKYFLELPAIDSALHGLLTAIKNQTANDEIQALRMKSILGLCLADMIDSKRKQSTVTNKAQRSFLACCDHLREQLSENPSRGQIAAAVGIHPGHVSRLFKQFHPGGYDAYLRTERAKRAKQLLQETQLTVEEVAHNCGVTNVSWFIRCFKQELGMTPGSYRVVLEK